MLLSSISREQRLHTPGGPPLSQLNYHTLHHGAPTELTDAQLLALILNEICIGQGKGFFCWFPEHMHNVDWAPNLAYLGLPWSAALLQSYSPKTHQDRLAFFETVQVALDRLGARGEPQSRIGMGITVRIFRTESDDDIISWQENTKGDLFLYYRHGVFRFTKLNRWREYGQRTVLSTFARMRTTSTPGLVSYIPTPSYQVRYGDIPEDSRVILQVLTINDVVQTCYSTSTNPFAVLGPYQAEVQL